MKRKTISRLLIAELFMVWGVSLWVAYSEGNDAGYWEHEAEENVYNCQVYYG